MILIRSVFAFIFLISIVGCQNHSGNEKEMLSRLDKLEKEMKSHNSSLNVLEGEINRITYKQIYDEQRLKRYDVVSFDPAATEGFALLDAGVARLAVMLIDVKPQADGIKVDFDLGNPTSALISDITYEIKYGGREPELEGSDYAKYQSQHDSWEKTLKTKSVSSVNDIKPGSWSRITLALPNVKSETLGYIELSLTAKQIALSKTQSR